MKRRKLSNICINIDHHIDNNVNDDDDDIYSQHNELRNQENQRILKLKQEIFENALRKHFMKIQRKVYFHSSST